MGYVNKAIVMGNIGKDLEIKEKGDVKFCRFSIATTYKNKSKETTTWHNIVCFGKTAENLVKYCEKGSTVYVEGRIENTQYKNKDGTIMYWSQIVANTIQYCDKKAK